MKSAQLFLVVLLAVGMSWASCNNRHAKDLIVKKWKIVNVTGGIANKLPDSIKNKMYATASMEFTADGKVIMNGMGRPTRQGSYSIADDNKTLTTTYPGTQATELANIVEITGNKLVIQDRKQGVKITFGSE